MTNPRLNLQGWAFHEGLKSLYDAYVAARSTTDKERKKLQERLARTRKSAVAIQKGQQGADPDDYNIDEYIDALNDFLSEEDMALDLIRQAFLITAFHYWERHVKAWTGKEYKESESLNELKTHGLAPEETRLHELRLIVNALKHSGGGSAKELYALRPDLFDPTTIKNWGEPTYEGLRLADSDFERYFEAVRISGPPRGKFRF